jgi:aryl-alcohol dehydrogenase-like predicted oxidoreductase
MIGNDRAFDVVDALKKIADEKSVTLSQLALAWVMHQDGITSAIIGPRTMEQYQDNLKARDIKLSDDDRKRIDAICPPGGHVVSFYDAAFGPHPNRW